MHVSWETWPSHSWIWIEICNRAIKLQWKYLIRLKNFELVWNWNKNSLGLNVSNYIHSVDQDNVSLSCIKITLIFTRRICCFSFTRRNWLYCVGCCQLCTKYFPCLYAQGLTIPFIFNIVLKYWLCSVYKLPWHSSVNIQQ